MTVCCTTRRAGTAKAVGVTLVAVCYAVYVLTRMSHEVVPLALRVDGKGANKVPPIMKNGPSPTQSDGILRHSVSLSQIDSTANVTRMDGDGLSMFSAASVPNSTQDRYVDKIEARVAFFFHVPKTGGDTVIGTIGHYGVEVSRVLGPGTERSSMARLESWTDGSVRPRRSHLIEIHGSTHPQTYLSKLAQFREDLTRRGIQVFVFTMLREPASWYRSAFNYICVQGGKCPGVNLTVDALVEGAILAPNAQCSFFVHGWSNPYDGKAQPVSEAQCVNVASQFAALVDWVGTTEDFEATMDVVREFFPEVGPTIRSNESKKKVNGTMSSEQASRISTSSELDHMLHVNASKGLLLKMSRTNTTCPTMDNHFLPQGANVK